MYMCGQGYHFAGLAKHRVMKGGGGGVVPF